ncbi:hypothetical protein VKT23_017320 [Stygiomarasmius scandens]|uniref:VHS domain-containing protein n=1 Tax=Marasmiellus scandens TaxID=2682957 RepID=A0ABR1IU66_9AGAR
MKKILFGSKPKQQDKDPIPQQHTPIHHQHAVYRDEDEYHLVETPSPRSPSPSGRPSHQLQPRKSAPVPRILKALDPDAPQDHQDHQKRDANKWFAGWNRDRDRDRDKQWQTTDKDSTALTRMIGFLTATSSEDWTLVLEVCEAASASDANAKEAVKALRREFKYGEPSAQLSAARLWAIMLRNSSDLFINQTTSRKFLDTLEDLIRNPATNPVVKERVLDVIAAAAYASASKKDSTGFRGLWRRVKSPDKPDEGIPFDTDDAMFNPPITGHPSVYDPTSPPYPGSVAPGTVVPMDLPPPKEEKEKPEKKHRPSDHKSHRKKKPKDKIIPLDEDIRRLFQECKIGIGNASLLGQAVGHTKPEELVLDEGKGKDVISEFRLKCISSQELIAAQIPWATAGAERSRREKDREKMLLRSQDTGRKRTISQSSINVINALNNSNPSSKTGSTTSIPLSLNALEEDFDEQTTEERLLGALLEANEELLGALQQYDDLKRLAEEKRVERRSRKEKRGVPPPSPAFEDSTSMPVKANTRARTPSPAGSFTTSPLPNPHPAGARSQTPTIRDRPGSRPSSVLMMHANGDLLVPSAPPAPAGPRSPSHSQTSHSHGIRSTSRTPSPRTPVLETAFTNGRHDVHVNVLDTLESLSRVNIGHKKLDSEEDDVQTPVKPSEKALGKRRVVEESVAETTQDERKNDGWGVDQDDLYDSHGELSPHLGGHPTGNGGIAIHENYGAKGGDLDDRSSLHGDESDSDDSRDREEYDRSRWMLKQMMHPPVHFVYDAVAERTKEWLKEGMKGIELQKESGMKEAAIVGM